MTDFVPPQNLEAEQSCLGSMLLERSAAVTAFEMLSSEDFYRPAHQNVFDACLRLENQNERTDLITLTEELRKKNKLQDSGGAEYLMALVESVPTAANVEYYARIVKDKAQRRRMIALTDKIKAHAFDENCENYLDIFAQSIIDCESKKVNELITLSDAVSEALKYLETIQEGQTIGIPFGLPNFDRLSYGIIPGPSLTIIGARPSNGKTALMNQLLLNAAIREERSLCYAFEDSAARMATRLMSRKSQTNLELLRFGNLDEQQEAWGRLLESASELHDYGDMILYEDVPKTIQQMTSDIKRTAARFYKTSNPLKLITVDYLQLIGVKKTRENRNADVGEIAQGLRKITQELKTPVVALSQLNRSAKDGMQTIADLREGGNQEGEANNVILVHNPPQTDEAGKPKHRITTLFLPKHRDGSTGKTTCYFDGSTYRFYELEYKHGDDEYTPPSAPWSDNTDREEDA